MWPMSHPSYPLLPLGLTCRIVPWRGRGVQACCASGAEQFQFEDQLRADEEGLGVEQLGTAQGLALAPGGADQVTGLFQALKDFSEPLFGGHGGSLKSGNVSPWMRAVASAYGPFR